VDAKSINDLNFLQVVGVDLTVQPPSYAVDLGGGSVRETEGPRLLPRNSTQTPSAATTAFMPHPLHPGAATALPASPGTAMMPSPAKAPSPVARAWLDSVSAVAGYQAAASGSGRDRHLAAGVSAWPNGSASASGQQAASFGKGTAPNGHVAAGTSAWPNGAATSGHSIATNGYAAARNGHPLGAGMFAPAAAAKGMPHGGMDGAARTGVAATSPVSIAATATSEDSVDSWSGAPTSGALAEWVCPLLCGALCSRPSRSV
jgi:hypothetical protein